MSRFSGGLSLLLLLAAIVPVHAEALPPASDIVPKVLVRDEATTAALKKYRYHQTVRTERLNPDGTVRHAEALETIVRPGQGDDFSVVGDRGLQGALLAPTEKQRKEEKESEKLKASFSLRRLAPRFDIRVAERAVWEGRPAYILAFTPKAGLAPAGGKIERILDQMKGRMWVAADDFTILHTEASLAHPMALAWFFATMTGLDFNYRTQRLPDGETVPAEFDIDYRIEVVTHAIRQRQAITMDTYRLGAGAAP
jgi:hypothetical protein